MTEATNKASEGLTREQLLDALDSEIGARENLTSRLGYSDWALKGAIVAISWTALNEITEGKHTVRGVMLIFFASYVVLMFLALITGDSNSLPTLESVKGNRRISTVRHALVRRGIHPGLLPYCIAECSVLLAVAIALGFYGFMALSVIAAVMLIIAIGLFLIALVANFVQVPLPLHAEIEEWRGAAGTFVRSGAFMATLVLAVASVRGVFSEWSSLSKGDLRLGMLLAALLAVLDIHVRLAKPAPDLNSLKSVRRRLAFGWIDFEAAKNETENILLGFPKDYYVASRAIQLIGVQKHVVSLLGQSLAEMKEVIALTTFTKDVQGNLPPTEQVREKISRINRSAYIKTKTGVELLDRAEDLEIRLRMRLRVARALSLVSDQESTDLLAKLSETKKESLQSFKAIQNFYSESFETWLNSLQFEASISRIPIRKLFAVVFKN